MNPRRVPKTEFVEYSDAELKALDTASPFKLVINTISVLITNAIPMYYVVYKGWSSFALLLLFVMEGVTVLGTDCLKMPFRKSSFYIEKNFKKSGPQILAFEFAFILFFGFFALIAFAGAEILGAKITFFSGGFLSSMVISP